MRGPFKAVLTTAGLLLLAACSRPAPGTGDLSVATAPVQTVYESMTLAIIPGSDLVWELAGNLYNDDGDIDSSLLSEDGWRQLKDAALSMKESARALAEARPVRVAASGVLLQNEGTPAAPSAADIQAAIDADPAGFTEEALKLVAIADELMLAADKRDGTKVDDVSARLTDVCSTCHVRFWYPGQP